MLSVGLADLQENAFDLSLLGFDDKELEKLLNGESDKDIEDDDFDLSVALEKASFVERSDIWTVGKKIYHFHFAYIDIDISRILDIM